MFGRRSEEAFSIVVSDMEKRIIIKALADLKDKQKEQNKNYDFIDSLIIRACDAPTIQDKTKARYETR